ncbi:MAG: hypothetical protein ACI4MH_05895 [Candidatus Coproplasma sp.]
MKFLKRFWKKLLNPSLIQGIAALWIGSVFIAAAVVLTLRNASSIGAFVCYAFAALSLAYIIYIFVYGIPRVKAHTLEFAEKHEFTHNLIKNYGFRTMVFAFGSLVLNVLYCIYNGAIAAYYFSLWYWALCAYYLFLSIMRGGLIIGTGKDKRNFGLTQEERELRAHKKYTVCGVLLIVFTLVVVLGIVRLTVFEQNETGSFHLIYVTAVYTVIRMVLAGKNLFKARKGGDPITQALRNVSFADALVAMLSLLAAILSAAGGGVKATALNAVLGNAVCVIIMVIGIRMVIKGRRALIDTVTTDGKRH